MLCCGEGRMGCSKFSNSTSKAIPCEKKTKSACYTKFAINGGNALARALKVQNTKYLYLNSNEMGDKRAACIGYLLYMTKTLTSLNLFDNNIGDLGACVIGDALETNSALTKLNLGFNKITNIGIRGLASALEVNTTIKFLHLGYNQIANAGAYDLSEVLSGNCNLTQLNLESNNIGNSGACILAKGLKHNWYLTELNLESNKIGDAGAVGLSKVLRPCNPCKVGNRVLAQVSDERKLKKGSKVIVPYGIGIVEKMNNDGGLDIRSETGELRKNIRLEDVKLVTQYPGKITAINKDRSYDIKFDRGDIRRACPPDEVTHSALICLILWGNRIGNKGAWRLKEAIRLNKTVTNVEIRENINIGPIATQVLNDLAKQHVSLRCFNGSDPKGYQRKDGHYPSSASPLP